MPTTEERLTDLETAVSDLQGELLLRARTSEVTAIENARDLVKTNNDSDHTDYETRLLKLERIVSVIQRQLATAVKRNSDDEIDEDIVMANDTVGFVLKDSEGDDWRLVVNADGDLSAESV